MSKQAFNQRVVIPNDGRAEYIARLLLYLNHVASCTKTGNLHNYVTNNQPGAGLAASELLAVLDTAVIFSPQALIGKIIIRDETRNGDDYVKRSALHQPLLCYELDMEASNFLSCSPAWLEKYYDEPIAKLPQLVFGTRHCRHCKGAMGTCSCAHCPRPSFGHCKPANALLAQFPITIPSGHRFSTSPVAANGGMAASASGGLLLSPCVYYHRTQ